MTKEQLQRLSNSELVEEFDRIVEIGMMVAPSNFGLSLMFMIEECGDQDDVVQTVRERMRSGAMSREKLISMITMLPRSMLYIGF